MSELKAKDFPLEKPVTKLDELCHQWRLSKQDEDRANAARIELERQIIAEFEGIREGTTRKKTAWYDVRVTGKVTRKLLHEHLGRLKEVLTTEELAQVIKEKIEANESGIKKLEKENPELFAKVAFAIEIKPAKTSVSIELLKKEDA